MTFAAINTRTLPLGPCRLADFTELTATAIQVRDDGAGGAGFARGTGLLGLKDRVEALSGRISLDSPRGAGTTLRAELPLTSARRVTQPGPKADRGALVSRQVV